MITPKSPRESSKTTLESVKSVLESLDHLTDNHSSPGSSAATPYSREVPSEIQFGFNNKPSRPVSDTNSPPLRIHSPSDVPDHIKLSGRIINATTNVPFAITKTAEGQYGIRKRRGNSALTSALEYLDKDTNWESIQVAWIGEIENPLVELPQLTTSEDYEDVDEADIVDLEAKLTKANDGGVIKPVWLLGKDPKRWRRYAENILWPILHYIQGEPSDGRQEKQWWYDYVKLNEAYCERILQIYRPGDIIWIHDYYLFLLPQILRMKIPNASIGFFMHAPFPSSEYFRCIPKRKELLEGILGSNLVATQSYAYSRHFISSCTRLLGVEGSPYHISAYGVHVSVDTLPIGIDTVKVERDAFLPHITEKVQAIRDLYPDKKIIVGRDRLDSVRGVVQKLHAFEAFLSLYPEWIENVVLIQVTSSAYYHSSKMEKKVSELVSHINGTYGKLNFAPIHHYPSHIARDEYLALLRVADLGLITSVRDGMNTTSLEFVVCQKENNSPLILSEFTGTAGSLVDAIQVNPWDAVGVAHVINQCLQQSLSSRASVEQRLYRHVTENTVQNWVDQYLTRLVANLERHDQSHVTPGLDRPQLLNRYKSASKRLFLFDYDGTLTPIVKEPSAAIPTQRLHSLLDKLTSDKRNIVWIISGRDSAFLERWLGDNKRLGFSAEHGCFLRESGSKKWINLAENFDMSWQKDVLEVFTYYTERTQGSHIERKRAALTWHYRRSDPEFGIFQARECKNHLEQTVAQQYDVEVMAGKANIEVRPKIFNKGEIVKRIVGEFEKRPEFVFCLGDDATDEDMFKALLALTPPEQSSADLGIFPVTVGPASKMTVAAWHLLDPASVLNTIGLLTGDVDLSESGGSALIDRQGRVINS